jgi:hypothetical protein
MAYVPDRDLPVDYGSDYVRIGMERMVDIVDALVAVSHSADTRK